MTASYTTTFPAAGGFSRFTASSVSRFRTDASAYVAIMRAPVLLRCGLVGNDRLFIMQILEGTWQYGNSGSTRGSVAPVELWAAFLSFVLVLIA
jgi:hypothetical protein